MSFLTPSFLMPQAAGLILSVSKERPAVEGREAKHEAPYTSLSAKDRRRQ